MSPEQFCIQTSSLGKLAGKEKSQGNARCHSQEGVHEVSHERGEEEEGDHVQTAGMGLRTAGHSEEMLAESIGKG